MISSFTELLIMGFGGHARSVADIALACGYSKLLFMDVSAREGEHFLDYPVLVQAPSKHWHCVLASGHNHHREMQMQEAQENGWSIETLLSPHATRGIGSQIGMGSLVAHHAHVGPMVVVGNACIINTGAIVEHECRIGDFSHVSINATVAGRVSLGRNVFIGAGAIVRNGLSICDQVTVGAGATVVSDIVEPGIYVGTPAKLMGRKASSKAGSD